MNAHARPTIRQQRNKSVHVYKLYELRVLRKSENISA